MHLMIDIETGGTEAGCAIFSIGACTFDPYGTKIEQTFYKEINHESNEHLGLIKSEATMNWWNGKEPKGIEPIETVLKELLIWISNSIITCYWANSPSFDIIIIKEALKRINKAWPLPYYHERDVRTLIAMIYPELRLENTHNALEDAIKQATIVQHAYRRPQ